MLDGEYLVEVNPNLCKGCGYCAEICTLNVFRRSDTVNAHSFKPMLAANSEECDGCEKCLMICPDFAITLKAL